MRRQVQTKSAASASNSQPPTITTMGKVNRLEKRLNLELPLKTEVYKTTGSKSLKKQQSTLNSRQQQQQQQQVQQQQQQRQQQIQLMQKTKLAPREVVVRQLKSPAHTSVQCPILSDAYKPVRTLEHSVHDVRNHIEAAKLAKLAQSQLKPFCMTAAAPTGKSLVPSPRLKSLSPDAAMTKMLQRERADEQQAKKRISRANCTYFDRYLKSAYNLAKPDDVRKLEAHFFPNIDEKCAIGDSPMSYSKTCLAGSGRVSSADNACLKCGVAKRRSASGINKVMVVNANANDVKLSKHRTLKKAKQSTLALGRNFKST